MRFSKMQPYHEYYNQMFFELTPEYRRAKLNVECAEWLKNKSTDETYQDVWEEFWILHSDLPISDSMLCAK